MSTFERNVRGLLGTKLGMTQTWDENNRVVPVTVVAAGTNVVTQVRLPETDGYNAVQLGYGEIDGRKVNKPRAGHFEKAGVTPRRHLVEIRTAEQQQAVAAYAQVGLQAFSDVETALAAEFAAREREQILTGTLADSQRALEIVRTQFKVGSTDLRFVTQRQLALNATQSALVRVQAEQRIQRVNLHLALGGSFGPRQ